MIRELEYTPETPKKKFNSFKVDWPLFTSKTSNINSYDSSKGVKKNLTIHENIIIDSAESSIPLSNGCKLHCPVPWWNKECWEAKKARSKANPKFKKTRSDLDYLNNKKQCAVARCTFTEAQKKSWKEFQSSINKDTPISKIQRKIDKISGKKVQSHVPTLSIKDEMLYDTKDVANALAKNISNISKGSSLPSFRNTRVNWKQN